MPKWAALSVHDHQLVFNLTHKDEVEFFLQTIKNQDFIVIKEFLYPSAKDSMLVTSKRKPLINQFIASLYHQEQVYKPASLPIENKQKPTRRLTPGSDWLYFKLYCHPARANEIIAGKVLPLLQPLMRQNAIDQWFYVRYTDPDFHLRLRLKVRAESMVAVSSLVNNHLNYLLKKQKIASYTIAIYERELERYGYDQITEFEKLFYQSSHLIATYLNQALADGGQPEYYLFGFSTARVMMDCFQLDGLARIFYLEKLVASYFTEFNGDAGLKYQLDQKFRKVQELLGKGEVYVPQIKERALEFKNALSLFYIKNKTLPTSKLNGWLADLIHMHLNRLFTDDARKQEFVLYYLMLKYEKAVYAKNKNVAAHTV